MDDSQLIKRVYAQIHKNVFNRKWDCLFNGCKKEAINSHLLQRNGILNTITTNGHLIEVKPEDAFKWKKNESPLIFKKVGLKSSMAMPLFCSQHDIELFKIIEQTNIDFNDYQSQLLFTYRAVCAEIRKKQRNEQLYSRLLNSNQLNYLINREDMISILDGTLLGIKDLIFYKELLERELLSENKQQDFIFKTHQYELVEICASATFSPIDYSNVDPEGSTPFNAVFVHVIPYKTSLYIIVGYHKLHKTNWIEKYFDSWFGLSLSDIKMKLTDLITGRVESFAISPLLFASLSEKKRKQFIKYWHENSKNLSEDQQVNFNLFEK